MATRFENSVIDYCSGPFHAQTGSANGSEQVIDALCFHVHGACLRHTGRMLHIKITKPSKNLLVFGADRPKCAVVIAALRVGRSGRQG